MSTKKFKHAINFADVTLDTRRYLDELQADLASQGFIFVEFRSIHEEEAYWQVSSTSSNAFIDKTNNALKTRFSRDRKINSRFWNSTRKKENPNILFIPIADLASSNKESIKSILITILCEWEQLSYSHWLHDTYQMKMDFNYQKEPLPIIGLWQYFKHYHNYLKYINQHVELPPQFLPHLKSDLFDIKGSSLDRILKYTFRLIESTLDQQEKPNPPESKTDLFYYDLAQKIFIHCEGGLENLALYEEFKRFVYKDYFDQMMHVVSRGAKYQINYGFPPFENSFFSVRGIKRILTQVKSWNAILDISPVQINFRWTPFLKEDEKFYRSTFAEILEVQNHYKKLSQEQKEVIDKATLLEWMPTLAAKASKAVGPSIYFDATTGIPQWNIPKPDRRKKWKAYYNLKLKSLKKDQALYRKLQNKAVKKHSLYTDETIKNQFTTSDLRKKWTHSADLYLSQNKAQNQFKRRKMIDLGMIEENDKITPKKEVWLEEMLKIEKEIQPYIPFVKNAFRTALPVRKSSQFHPFRHDPFGPEFDPDTAFDQSKWVRGDIMKTMTTQKSLGDVTQINTFCLDYSASMNHNKMRNLFKVLYLLVLGLEDRKSFDAFHFFSNTFIEGMNFQKGYTNTKVLFKILSKISTVNGSRVVYFGNSGTNISDGLDGSYERMIAFSDEMKKRSPHLNMTKSIFVITDGEPSVGIINRKKLAQHIDKLREENKVAIKGIYLREKKDKKDFMKEIFGEKHYVENIEFQEAVTSFVNIMTDTYKTQREDFKWNMKRERLNFKL